MLKRYIALKPFLSNLNVANITDLLPSPNQSRDIAKTMDQLEKFYSVTMVLQGNVLTINDAKA